MRSRKSYQENRSKFNFKQIFNKYSRDLVWLCQNILQKLKTILQQWHRQISKLCILYNQRIPRIHYQFVRMLQHTNLGQTQVKIVGKRRVKGNLQYLVVWPINQHNQPVWQPIINLQRCLSAIQSYESSLYTKHDIQFQKKQKRSKKIDFSKVFDLPNTQEKDEYQKIEIAQSKSSHNQQQIIGVSKKRPLILEESLEKVQKPSGMGKKIKQNERIAITGRMQIVAVENKANANQFQDLFNRRIKKQQQIQYLLNRSINNKHYAQNSQVHLYQNIYNDIAALNGFRKHSVFETASQRQNQQNQNMHQWAHKQHKGNIQSMCDRYNRHIRCDQLLLDQCKRRLLKAFNIYQFQSDSNQIEIICIENLKIVQQYLQQLGIQLENSGNSKIIQLIKHRYGWIALGLGHFGGYTIRDITDLSETQWYNLQKYFGQN